jgi:hypothetical protein
MNSQSAARDFSKLLSRSFLATSLMASSLAAQGAGFANQSVISTQTDRPADVYASDLDGDGDLDVLSASSFGDTIVWFENVGGGSFGLQQIISLAVNQPSAVFAADLDGDGDQDVLVASGFEDEISWFENLGAGAFGPQRVITVAADGAQSVFAIDLDGDGDLDVLSASTNDSKVAFYANLGNGTFGAQQAITTAAAGANDVFAADLDGDGDADVLSVSFLDDKLAWYQNLGAGLFGPQQVISTASTFYASVRAADLDGDGDLDVLAASPDDSEVSWHANLGGGNFGPQQIISLEVPAARSVEAADFDGDGDLDVVAIGSGAFNSVGIWENLGGGIFGPLQAIEVGNSQQILGGQALFVADVDGDGVVDVLTASSFDDKLAWYRNWPSVQTFGAGCGSGVSLVFSPSSAAVVGAPVSGVITHSPTALCVVALGLSNTTMPAVGALPFDLGAFGMTGCSLYQSNEVFGLATQSSPIPFLGVTWSDVEWFRRASKCAGRAVLWTGVQLCARSQCAGSRCFQRSELDRQSLIACLPVRLPGGATSLPLACCPRVR